MRINVSELDEKMGRGEDFLLLDVRTQGEYDTAHIEGSTLIPLHELADAMLQLADWKDKEIVCMCHLGGRSAQAQALLLQAGFTNVLNLTGGIDDYAAEVDPSIPRYC